MAALVESNQRLTGEQVAEIIGCPYRTIMRWTEAGLVRPAGYVPGRGYAAEFSAKELHELWVLRHLRDMGVPLQRIRAMIERLRELGHNPLSKGKFVVLLDTKGEPADVFKIMDGEEVLSLIRDKPSPQMRLFPLDPRRRKLTWLFQCSESRSSGEIEQHRPEHKRTEVDQNRGADSS